MKAVALVFHYSLYWSILVAIGIAAMDVAADGALARGLSPIALAELAVAGTMVALVTPSAGLVADYVNRKLQFWASKTLNAAEGGGKISDQEPSEKVVSDAGSAIAWTLRGGIYVGASFGCFLICSLVSAMVLPTSCALPVINILVFGVGNGLLIVGIVWLVMPVGYILRQNIIEDTAAVVHRYLELLSSTGKAGESALPVTATQSTPDDSAHDTPVE